MSIERRQFLRGGALIAMCGAVWVAVSEHQRQGSGKTIAPDAFFERVCDLLIPATDTPGALAAGVPKFLAVALSHQLAGATANDRALLESELNTIAANLFVALDAGKQRTALTTLDQSQFALPASIRPADSAWPRIKKLIVMGYYTSEVGAAQELQYALVPGRFDPDVPVKPGDRGWSSDWVGQQF